MENSTHSKVFRSLSDNGSNIVKAFNILQHCSETAENEDDLSNQEDEADVDHDESTDDNSKSDAEHTAADLMSKTSSDEIHQVEEC